MDWLGFDSHIWQKRFGSMPHIRDDLVSICEWPTLLKRLKYEKASLQVLGEIQNTIPNHKEHNKFKKKNQSKITMIKGMKMEMENKPNSFYESEVNRSFNLQISDRAGVEMQQCRGSGATRPRCRWNGVVGMMCELSIGFGKNKNKEREIQGNTKMMRGKKK